jgi:RHS repeat-associated protein
MLIIQDAIGYLWTFVYNCESNAKTLESTSFGGGRINKTDNNSYDINYFITDHLGSTRAIVNANGEIKEQKDFYPFGKEHENPDLITSTNRWTFSGKEKQIVGGVNFLEFSNRMYDDFTCRWTTPDPLQEKFYSWSSYNYCMNNPLKFIDPDGKFGISVHKKIVSAATQNKGFTKQEMKSMLRGTGIRADFYRGTNIFSPITKYKDIHMDNKANYTDISNAYSDAASKLTMSLNAGEYKDVGEAAHTIADFYAHSNYIDLYTAYATENGIQIDANNIPTLNEAMNNENLSDFKTMLQNPDTGLRTGNWGKGTDKNAPDHHNQMNLDSGKHGYGSKPIDGTDITRHDAAVNVATRDIENRIPIKIDVTVDP